MLKTTHWDDETTAYFLELLAESFSCRTCKTPSTPLYQHYATKMCERYGFGEYTVDALRSKYQRMKKRYKIYVRVSTNTGIGWDEETQTCIAPDDVIKDFAKGCADTEKICRKRLANLHLYKPVFSKIVATGFYATALGDNCPPSMQMPFDESDEEIEVDPDLSELPGPQSGDNRASSSRQQAKQSRKKKSKMQQSADETFLNMASIMTERFGIGEHHVDGPPKDQFDLSACAAIVRTMDLDQETHYRAIEFLRKQDKETKKAFVEFDPYFRRFWLLKTMGRE